MSGLAPIANLNPTTRNLITDPADLPIKYGMICDGDCMDPEIKDGEAIGFVRDAPVERGDLAAFIFRPELVPPGELQVLIKRIVMPPPPWVSFPHHKHPNSEFTELVIAEQINPRRQYEINCTDLLAIHLCIGRLRQAQIRKEDIPKLAVVSGEDKS